MKDLLKSTVMLFTVLAVVTLLSGWQWGSNFDEGDLDMQNYSINGDESNGLSFDPDSDGFNEIVFNADGTITVGSYVLPASDGDEGQALITDGGGTITFGDVSASGDATPSGWYVGTGDDGSSVVIRPQGGITGMDCPIGFALTISDVTADTISATDWDIPGDLIVQGDTTVADLTASGDLFTNVRTLSVSGNFNVTAGDMRGTVFYCDGPATATIAPVFDGANFTIITIGAVAISADPNASDLIILDGTVLDDGDKITNTSTSGDIAVFTYFSTDGFYATTNSWEDTGA